MRFEVKLVPSAEQDLDYYKAHDRRIILDGISTFLVMDADVETKRRKPLRPNPIAPWELKMGDYRSSTRSGKRAW